jgi:hypothetical protein
MMDRASETAQDVVLPQALWMVNNVVQPPQPQASKFDQVFDQERREWISRRLRLGEFERIKSTMIRI